MDAGLDAISIVADHAAVGAVFGAGWALATGRRDVLDLGLAGGMIAGAAYGILVVFSGLN